MTPRHRGLRRRGQNLVLLALTMLFLALMVTMTLGLGLRIRQKHELQTLADAAAYSNAVITARTFNNMALVNRLQVSYWVAIAADESLISWAAYARAMANGSHNGAQEILRSACGTRLRANDPRTYRELQGFRRDVWRFVDAKLGTTNQNAWRINDRAAGEEALQIQILKIVGLRDELAPRMTGPVPGNLRDELFRELRTQRITKQLLSLARQDDISVLETGSSADPSTAAQVSLRDVDCDYGGAPDAPLTDANPTGSGLCLRASWNENMLHAAMGSRGHDFLTGRPQLPNWMASELQKIAGRHPGVSLSFGAKAGSAYWANQQTDGKDPRNTEAWGDDHGSLTVRAGGCSDFQELKAHVRSTDLVERNDEHMWSPHLTAGPGVNGGGDSDEAGDVDTDPDTHHTMGDCTPLCPSVWVRTIGFKPSPDESNAWGQPKVMVALRRDLTQRTFPWELHFKFPFSATGPAAEWDGRGRVLTSRQGGGLNVSQQIAISTGIVYYHRYEHWDEFPNLLNPFWRASLGAHDVDAQGPNDVRAVLSGRGHRWQGDAYQALRAAGYEGLH